MIQKLHVKVTSFIGRNRLETLIYVGFWYNILGVFCDESSVLPLLSIYLYELGNKDVIAQPKLVLYICIPDINDLVDGRVYAK